MKVLFLVHVEEMFRGDFPDDEYPQRLVDALEDFDRVICLVSGINEDVPIVELDRSGYCMSKWQWGWGYEPDMFHDDDKKWCISSHGHQWTMVPEELREPGHWKNHEIVVGGGCSAECLQDFINVLDHQEIPHTVVWDYVF